MSRMKKIVISIMIGLIAVLGANSVSNAYHVGQSLNISYNTYAKSKNIFCMEHWQALSGSNAYKVVSNVKIDGLTSTDHKGKSIDSKYNARFAYIIGASKTSKKSRVSNAIWNFGHTWMKEVGKNHAGLYEGFASSVKGGSETLNAEAKKYAENLSTMGKVEDKTDKSKIQIESYQKDGNSYIRVGPFKWNYSGTLADVKVYDQDKKNISDVAFSTFNGKTEKFISADKISSGKEFYVSIPAESGVSKIASIKATVKISIKTSNIWFLKAKTGYKQNLIIVEPGSREDKVETDLDYGIDLLGDLKVVKIDRDKHEKKLAGVGFIFQNKSTGKYVKKTGETISYVVNKNDATEFVTDSNGKIEIKNLIVGDYLAYETKNPNNKYEIIKDGISLKVTVDKTDEIELPNTQIKVDLSGYVWVDVRSGKQSELNYLYKDGEYDPDDMLLDGIKVRLMRKGKTDPIAITTTSELNRYKDDNNGHGEYLFENVPLYDDSDKERKNKILDQYYIEFEYDGVTYQSFAKENLKFDKNNGSKAKENDSARQEFNNGFATVEGSERNSGITYDLSRNKTHDLYYNLDQTNHAAILDKTRSYYPITSSTGEAGYNIQTGYQAGNEEIKYINLGLYEREQPDLALMKDLSNVKMTVNGKAHVYEYNQRFEHEEEYGDGFNVGVKFGEKYGAMSYSRAVYTADYEYETSDKSKELKVYATYRIKIRNQSTNLKTKVNSIIDYYDSNYSLIRIGTGIENGNITGELAVPTSSSYNSEYNKAIIDVSKEIKEQGDLDIYMQFELSKDAVLKILNNKENLNNVAEINSYSVYDKDGKVYAGIDKDSNPGNVIPGDKTTYEDDTDEAPGLLLEVAANARELTGKVFLDSTSNELKTGDIREGSGKYEDGEKGISGVQVTLTENTGSGKVYTAQTDTNGDFYISGYIPGDYTLTYTWGDETYTVQNYKGTVVDNNRWSKNNSNAEWYKEDADTRYSDAIDNYNNNQEVPKGSRKQIDAEMGTTDAYTRTKMDSTTATMDMEIEITSTTTTSYDDKFIPEGYKVRNIDFGIVERARQAMDISKKVSTFKVTLANGQVITDAKIDENGNLTGSTNYITYIKPNTSNPSNGQIWLQLDNELIQGANVQVGYEIKVSNNSELDFDNSDYYNFGTNRTNPIKIKPTGVYDYLDGMVMDTSKDNGKWEVISEETYNNKYTSDTLVEKYFSEFAKNHIDAEGKIIDTSNWNNTESRYRELYTEWAYDKVEGRTVRDSKLSDKIILHNEDLEADLEPGKSNVVTLNTAVQLANSNEIDLNNDVEITEVKRLSETGRMVTPEESKIYDQAQTVTITPPTGDNSNYIIIVISTVVVGLIILGVGVMLIKKKALEK